MTGTCETCGNEGQGLELLELGFGELREDMAITLCPGCAGLRQVDAWNANDPRRDPLEAALGDRRAPPQDHYTYLKDQEGTIRLMRLRPGWVDRHAVARMPEA